MSEGQEFPVPAEWAARARINAGGYDAAVRRVETDPEGYWSELGRRLDWIKPFTKAKDVSFAADDFHIRWYEDGVLN
ncbi:MAG TPA: acetyl-coenzyme A synthetase N-terminal domain-containing protein, partial [Caulobacteraceae bacterium]